MADTIVEPVSAVLEEPETGLIDVASPSPEATPEPEVIAAIDEAPEDGLLGSPAPAEAPVEPETVAAASTLTAAEPPSPVIIPELEAPVEQSPVAAPSIQSPLASPSPAQVAASTPVANGGTPASPKVDSTSVTPIKATSATPTPTKVATTASPALPDSSTPTPDPTPASALPLSNGSHDTAGEDVSNSVSVKDLKKQLSMSGSSTPTPKPITPSASSQQLSPRVSRGTKENIGPAIPRSEHDSKNTTNASEMLKLGVFKLQPLKDFIAYDELIKLRLEDGIDPARKEDYLTEEEFATVLGMTRDEFAKIPTWRKTNLKKTKCLW